VSVHYTSIGPFNTRIEFEGETVEAKIVAFGWEDAEPTKATGVWIYGPAVKNALGFLPIEAIAIKDD
jgi:hypothetical protein